MLDITNIGLLLFTYLTGALFCLDVYLKSRGKTNFELTLPLYARLAIFVYGFESSGILSFLLTGQTKYLLFISGNSGIPAFTPYFVFYLGIMVAAFIPINLRVGEPDLASEGRI